MMVNNSTNINKANDHLSYNYMKIYIHVFKLLFFKILDGNYLLLNGHKVHNYNWSATFSSPRVNIQQYTNMSFWYHMNGVGIGHLAVYAEYSNGYRDTLVFMSGRQSPEWQHVTVELPPGIYKVNTNVDSRLLLSCVTPLVFLLWTKTIFCFPIFRSQVPDKCYSRNASCALNYISTSKEMIWM